MLTGNAVPVLSILLLILLSCIPNVLQFIKTTSASTISLHNSVVVNTTYFSFKCQIWKPNTHICGVATKIYEQLWKLEQFGYTGLQISRCSEFITGMMHAGRIGVLINQMCTLPHCLCRTLQVRRRSFGDERCCCFTSQDWKRRTTHYSDYKSCCNMTLL